MSRELSEDEWSEADVDTIVNGSTERDEDEEIIEEDEESPAEDLSDQEGEREADVDMIVYDSTDRDEEEENCCEESTEEDEESPAEDLPDQEGERDDDRRDSGTDNEESSEEEGKERIDLEALTKERHPCLAEGRFSIFNSPHVQLATIDDITYNIDMDGFVVLSKCLSTFRVTKYGEARAWTTYPVLDMHAKICRSNLFDDLPAELASFNKWLPAFRLTDSIVPYCSVYVILRPKPTASANVILEWQTHTKNLPRLWWNSVFIPALRFLPADTRTSHFNIIRTVQRTGILPSCMHLYDEDMANLDIALDAPTCGMDDFKWYFMIYGYGQRKLIDEAESLGPESFGLGEMLDLTKVSKISLHIAINFACTNTSYSLFWHRERTYRWIRSTSDRKNSYPLFGLSELGNITAGMPTHPVLQWAVGDRCVTYAQFYTPTAKAMDERVPLKGHPYLLTYLLGKVYVSTQSKFKHLWDEISTHRTFYELLEVVHPSVPLNARMEIVVTDDDTSFLASYGHRRLTRRFIKDGLLVKVPVTHFAGYVMNLVKELYAPLRAAINDDLKGPGTLGTVVLCESLLSYLSTGSYQYQPYKVFRAYDIAPMSSLHKSRKIDLRRFATTQNDILYVRRPALQRLFIPAYKMTPSTRATVKAMLNFLDQLSASPRSRTAITRAATIIVEQYRRDLCEMGIVQGPHVFQGNSSVCIRDAMTAEEYVSLVFDSPEQLPSGMSIKGFLHTALDLFKPCELHARLVDAMMNMIMMVPHTSVHSRAVNFSPSVYTIIIRGSVSGSVVSPEDAHRLVLASTQLLKENFIIGKQRLIACQKFRPRLVQCVMRAIEKARSRTGGRLRHILAVVAYAVVALADQENLLAMKPNYKKLRERTNMYRYILKVEMDEILRMIDLDDGETGRRQIPLRTCRVVVNKATIPRSSNS